MYGKTRKNNIIELNIPMNKINRTNNNKQKKHWSDNDVVWTWFDTSDNLRMFSSPNKSPRNEAWEVENSGSWSTCTLSKIKK